MGRASDVSILVANKALINRRRIHCLVKDERVRLSDKSQRWQKSHHCATEPLCQNVVSPSDLLKFHPP